MFTWLSFYNYLLHTRPEINVQTCTYSRPVGGNEVNVNIHQTPEKNIRSEVLIYIFFEMSKTVKKTLPCKLVMGLSSAKMKTALVITKFKLSSM